MNLFIIVSHLTTIKSKKEAKAVLDTLNPLLKTNSVNEELSFSLGNVKCTIRPSSKPEHFLFYYYQDKIDWKTPGIEMNEEESVKELYEMRKHYNQLWRE